jgi:hypothetical protein
LKCLNEDSEIENLIKREIDAREWFVFINSENSRRSKWVTLEREYITETNSKKIITIDIDDERNVAHAIQKITHSLRVFISYSNRDQDLARRIKERLEQKDYLVFFESDSLSVGASYLSEITNALRDASRDGCVLALITPDFVRSRWTQREILYASQEGGNIIPVIVNHTELDAALRYELYSKQCYHISDAPTDEEIDELIDRIGWSIVQ